MMDETADGLARRRQYVAQINAGGQKKRTDNFVATIGNPQLIDVKFDSAADYHAKIRYTIPLAWCHSFDPDKPIGTEDGDDNLPIVQGGLIGSCMDNAMTTACRVASDERFQTTLAMTVEFLRGMRPGYVYALTRATMIGGTVGFAEVTVYRDIECTYAVAKGTSTNKLRKPTPKL
eukprot:COSAG02_NODE_6553_length_3500_cov_1.405763_2_plen_176_part_00